MCRNILTTLLSSVVALATPETKISNLNQNDASVIKVFDYYCLCQLKTLHLCALQYLIALAFVTLISNCISPTNSSRYYVLWAPIARYDP